MKRGELKQIIKECLIEILAEGIGAERLEETIQRTPSKSKQHYQPQTKPKYDPVLDQKVQGKQQIIVPKTKDSIMDSMLEETARAMAEMNDQHGYGEPLSPPMVNDSYSSQINDGNGPSYREQFNGDPLAIFGGGGNSAMWQKAAFGVAKPK